MRGLHDFDRLVHQPLPGVAALGLGILIGVALGFLLSGTESTTAVTNVTTVATSGTTATRETGDGGQGDRGGQGERGNDQTTAPGTAAATEEMSRWRGVLDEAVAEAGKLGGTSEVAVWLKGWPSPVTAGDASRRIRLWSLSKPVTAVAVLERIPQPGPALQGAIHDAITRSENCRQRRVVLGLEQVAGGREQAGRAIADVFDRAGASGVEVSSSAAPADASCVAYLTQARKGIRDDPLGPALQLGVSTWTVTDAVKFMKALGDGIYGDAGKEIVRLMALPKERSREQTSDNDFTTSVDWGAGRSFRGLELAYKAGWGGVAQQRFLASQAGFVDIAGRRVAFMAAFHPAQQPPTDDPGKTKAPQALEAIFDRIEAAMKAPTEATP